MLKRICIFIFILASLTQIIGCTNNTTIKTEIKVSPSPGAYLIDPQNVLSGVLLKDIQVNKSISDNHYFALRYPSHTVDADESIFVVSGSIQNKQHATIDIQIYAEGYDETEKQVAWTLINAQDAYLIDFRLDAEETSEFTLRLDFSENIRSIRIYAERYVPE
jgi:hypothetical protein